jgi:hypothetical protein
MIFTPDRRPKIILPATFSLSNPGDPVFNNTLLEANRADSNSRPFVGRAEIC